MYFNIDLIIKDIGLLPSIKEKDSFVLAPGKTAGTFNQTYDIHTFFDNAPLITPDNICRPRGDTTLFTTAGAQHIETILHTVESINCKDNFSVYQPSIRMQFAEDVKDGTSTSFVNFSAINFDSSYKNYVEQTQNFITLLLSYGVKPNQIKCILEDNKSATWGEKNFTTTILSFLIDDFEVGESILMHNYPLSAQKSIAISEIGIGVERLNWKTGKTKYYFENFDDIYAVKATDKTTDDITGTIDCMRTATLITQAGIKPSFNNQGYRLRVLSKKFVARNQQTGLEEDALIQKSFDWWKSKGVEPCVSLDETRHILTAENTRNYNAFVINELKRQYGIVSKLDINQPTDIFLKKIVQIIPKPIVPIFLANVKKR